MSVLGIKIAQKPNIVWSLGPKALIYESLGLGLSECFGQKRLQAAKARRKAKGPSFNPQPIHGGFRK